MIDRYTLPEMARIWAPENRYRKWLEIEILVCEAWARKGKIPTEVPERIRQRASFDLERIRVLEEQTRHDVIAFVRSVSESLGDDGKYIHYGLTSYDVVDTALSLLMKEAAEAILAELEILLLVLKEKAREYKHTLMAGRTHGVHAEPITFGLKMALWLAESHRNLLRLKRARESISVGKISGAVGTYAHVDPWVERYVCDRLGLKPAAVSTQILQRDRHAHYLSALAILGSSLDKFATEIRGLQRTEVREVEEPFQAGQKGSSAMPHKRNPVLSEQLSGLSRVLRGNLVAALENIPLWHERDISNSSVERIIIPDSTTLAHYMVRSFTKILRGMRVYPERMRANLESTHGLVFSERVLLALIDAGLSREAAYDAVQESAMKAWEEGADFKQLLLTNPTVSRHLTPEILEQCFDYQYQLRHIDEVFDRLGI